MVLAGRDDDDFMAEARGRPKLRIHIGPNAAAAGRIKCANVDDPPERREAAKPNDTQVKVCSWTAKRVAPVARRGQTANDMPGSRVLLASIHDVSPRFEGDVDRLTDLLRPHVGDRIAMLVVPNHWGSAPIAQNSSFASRLREWSNEGFEVFLHGFYHRDASPHDSLSSRLRSKLMTAGEGEFLCLPRRDAASRIAEGRKLLEDITGREITGFIAPAWLYGQGALEALAEAEIRLAEDHFRVWSPANDAQLARGPVITWASRTKSRLLSSLMAAGALRRAPIKALRIGVHPPDVRHQVLVRSIQTTLSVASRTRTPARYGDLLAA